MTEAELLALDPRRDLLQIRRDLAAMLSRGDDVGPLYAALASCDLVALTDLVVGPQALRGPGAGLASLGVLAALETSVSPAGLYRRLVDLDPGAGPEVLRAAAERHPSAGWVVTLSEKVEGVSAGLIHLRTAAELPSSALRPLCLAHARAGHTRGLIAFAGETARLEPVLVLLQAGPVEAAAEAAVRALEADPGTPVIETLAAVWGPDLDLLLCRMLPHLRSARTAKLLEPYAEGFPVFAQRYAVVRRALFR